MRALAPRERGGPFGSTAVLGNKTDAPPAGDTPPRRSCRDRIVAVKQGLHREPFGFAGGPANGGSGRTGSGDRSRNVPQGGAPRLQGLGRDFEPIA